MVESPLTSTCDPPAPYTHTNKCMEVCKRECLRRKYLLLAVIMGINPLKSGLREEGLKHGEEEHLLNPRD